MSPDEPDDDPVDDDRFDSNLDGSDVVESSTDDYDETVDAPEGAQRPQTSSMDESRTDRSSTDSPGEGAHAPGSGGDSWTGGQSPVDEKFCLRCGARINRRADVCPTCGVRQRGEAAAGESSVDRTTAAVFALLLGELGAHKFYLGKPGQGVLYLCFFWTLIPGIVGIVEGIMYLSETDEAFHRKRVE